jgi:hypothetical protein
MRETMPGSEVINPVSRLIDAEVAGSVAGLASRAERITIPPTVATNVSIIPPKASATRTRNRLIGFTTMLIPLKRPAFNQLLRQVF